MMANESSPRLSDDQAAELGARVVRALRREHAAKAEGLEGLVSLAFERGVLRNVTSPEGPDDAARSGQRRRPDDAGRSRLQRLAAVAAREGALAAIRELEDAGVTCAVMKGFATAPRYGRPHLRRMADVDLLIKPADLDRVRDVLRRRGYREAKSDAIEVSFGPGPGRALMLDIDVHVRLSYPGQFDFDIDGMLGRATREGSIPVLAPEDAVLVACGDMARDGFCLAGRSMTDIAVLATTSPVDWDTVVERARAWGLVAAAWVALVSARKTLGAPVPASAIERLTPSFPRRAYLRLWLDLGRLSPYRLTSRGTSRNDLRGRVAFVWPVLVDGPWRRAAFVARYPALKLRSFLGRRRGPVS